MAMFTDRLSISLTLTIAGTAHTIPGGNVKGFDLDLVSWGFAGSVDFDIANDADHGGGQTDALLSAFLGQDLVEVTLSIGARWDWPETSASIQPVSVTGLVTRKSLSEVKTASLAEEPILVRRYRVEFADPAAVLWKQHFPCVLYTQKSVQDVIDAQKGSAITVTYDSTTLGTALPLFFLHLDTERRASFLDFMFWYLDTNAKVWAYDYTAKGYKISDAKDATGTAVTLFGDDVGKATLVFPETARASAAVLNSYTEGVANTAVANAQAVTGIRKDYLLRSPIAQDTDDRVALETSRLVLRSNEVELQFRRFPTITLQPGSLLSLVAANLWSSEASLLTPTWRVWRYRLSGRAQGDAETDRDEESTRYDLEMSAHLEQQTETFVHLPPFRVPRYPAYVEGKVVSEQGADDEITYQNYTDDTTKLNNYKITVPLWADQQITVPYAPKTSTGAIFMPAYKNARVLLAIGLLTADVAEVLDWRTDAQLTMDVQGEKIQFGKGATKGTSISHTYDGENPTLNVARVHEKDNASIVISEGSLVITVTEDS
jgi:hypothetical protein